MNSDQKIRFTILGTGIEASGWLAVVLASLLTAGAMALKFLS